MSAANPASPRDYLAVVKAEISTDQEKPRGGTVSLIRHAILCLRLRPDAPFPSQVRARMTLLRLVK
jgi:hypothetical protein